ncbi:PaaI family thioesterase [Hydrogenophaga sp.]|uniref:PaaI family thioesterase n=1 Tax=Hydrogenophaga sp. TaxID=1904254 RepID=UPI003F6FEE9D
MQVSQKLIHLATQWSPKIMFDIVRKQMSRSVPFARWLGISVDALDKGQAHASVKESPDLLNHVGTFHAGVLFTTCETASGAALAGALLPMIMQTRFVVKEARMSYLKPAKGLFTAHATLVDDLEALLKDLRQLGRAEVAVDVNARSEDGIVIARATFHWMLKLQES